MVTAEAPAVSLATPAKQAASVERSVEYQELTAMPRLKENPLGALAWILQTLLGFVCLVALLVIAASIPLVNLIAMGYLMVIQARVARSGKLRSAFFLIPAARRLGGIVLAVWLWILPIAFLAQATSDAWVLAPGTTSTWLWTVALIASSLIISVHLLLAMACGGGWWRFARPISNIRRLRARVRAGGYRSAASDAACEYVGSFELLRMIRLGLLGFVAAYLWLTLPMLMFTTLDDVTNSMQVARFIGGSIVLTIALPWIPMLLVHVAVAERPKAVLELGSAIRLALQSPFRWLISTVVLMACGTLPLLYTALVKNQLPPHTARWDLMLVFLVTAVPARVLIGWVYHHATQKDEKQWSWWGRLWQLLNVTLMLIGSACYVYFLNLAANDGLLGRQALWQLHTVLLPFPF